MKKILIILILASFLSYSNSNLLDNTQTDYKLEAFFNAIKIYNNKYASSFITGYKIDEVEKKDNNFSVLPEKEETVVFDKIDINKSNKEGYTAAIIASEYNNDVVLKELIDNGVNLDVSHPVLGKTILNTAVYYDSYNIVKLLLQTDPSLVNKQDPLDGWTPLMVAVLKNNKNIVKLLLDNGADPLIKDYTDATALDLAVKYGKGQLIKMMRDYIMKKE